jgi:SAM-dependent methyltransferase
LPRPEFEEQEVWERLYAADENQLAAGMEEHSWTEGEDGEGEFDRRVIASAKNKDVIDIGCGTGEFSFKLSTVATMVAGVDFSKRALKKAFLNQQSLRASNVEFALSAADRIPYSEGSFDLAISRRGPALDTEESTREAYRVLRKGGELVAQEIGERDKQNWARVFGRGQMYPATARIAIELEKKLTDAGFGNISVDEFEANEYFASIQDVLMRLENSPIIPDFKRELDDEHLRGIAKKFTTTKGIQTSTHRVLIKATK